jgi:predicted ABC-type transport system involved in lysophospholipase L1 biosynthesis ATPase subunit
VILTFEHTDAELAAGLAMRDLLLRVGPGECVAVQGPAKARAAFADLALGLRDPDAGRVAVDGEPWAELSAMARARVRERMGCALDRPGFLSNLDVTENLALAERLHRGRSAAEVLAEAAELAERLGFGAIPDCRPYTLDAVVLHRLAIVRALLGARQLLLLEEVPGALADGAAVLFRELAGRRKHGAGIVWLSAEPAPGDLEATATLDLRRYSGREDAA